MTKPSHALSLFDTLSRLSFIQAAKLLGPEGRRLLTDRHRVTDEKGRVLGYKNLDLLRESLKPVLLRRTRSAVMRDLPPRTTEIVRIPPTDEQFEIDGTQMQVVSTIVKKKYISEMDLLRLQKALLLARMAADSTYLVDKRPPGFSSKLERLEELFEQLAAEQACKIVLFSEWTTMLTLIEKRIERFNLDHVRLDGSVPQKKRQQLVHQFQRDPACRAFLTTNAGSTGLNLQAANTVINVDLPWNPAVLEQRIARAHRIRQKRPVQVFLLVIEGTIEERLLSTLSAKHDLALAALDMESNVKKVSLVSGIEELRQRLEVLLGARLSQSRSLGMDPTHLVDRHTPVEEKMRLFRSLFRGREDVYARRFESRKTGRSGYAPACANEWVRGICEKPRIKCAECPHRRFLPVTDEVIRWLASLGRRRRGQALRRRHLSSARGRQMLVRSGRFRQERTARGCLCLSRDLPAFGSSPPLSSARAPETAPERRGRVLWLRPPPQEEDDAASVRSAPVAVRRHR